jgi:hypothetical protein
VAAIFYDVVTGDIAERQDVVFCAIKPLKDFLISPQPAEYVNIPVQNNYFRALKIYWGL